MKQRRSKPAWRHYLLAGLACLFSAGVLAQGEDFSFGVIAQAPPHDESQLREAIIDSDADNLAFVLVNGFKLPTEPCTDEIYQQRMNLLDSAKNGLILSLASSDWIRCNGVQNHSSAIGRLNRVREIFFSSDMSLGASKLPLIRQSGTVKFRSYAENARWTFGDIMFATINLPAENNHYLSVAGRNSEFEDRQVATREWLKRIFIFATQRKMAGIVLFCDGNPLVDTTPRALFARNIQRDGFREFRRQLKTLAATYRGQILLVHGQAGQPATAMPAIQWEKNLGALAAYNTAGAWIKLKVRPATAGLFSVANEPPASKEKSRGK